MRKLSKFHKFIRDFHGNRCDVILQRDHPLPGHYDFLVKNTSNSHVIVYEGFDLRNSRFMKHHDYGNPYENTSLQFDFMILNAKESAENFNPESHHVFIEVKDDDTKYIDDLQEKRNLVNANDDVLLIITDKTVKYLKEMVEESINVKNLKGKIKSYEYEILKLKNILKKNGIKY